MFCILHLFIFHGANRIDGGAPRGDLSCPSDNSPSEGTPLYSIILYYGMLVKPLDKMYPVGCDKVNCGNAAREGALGYDSAHRIKRIPLC